MTIGGQIPDPTRFGLDVVFPAAMVGLGVGLVTGRRELVAALAGAIIGIGVSLVAGPGVGVVAGGIGGPLLGMTIPRRVTEEATALGTKASAERYAMPGSHFRSRDGKVDATPERPGKDGLP